MAVVRRESQHTFYAHGIPVLTTPVPDLILTEDIVHLPLLFVPQPRRVLVLSGAIGGSYFEYLLGRFTEPNEIFGPVNLSRLREGAVETDTAGMLPEADVAFLDEVFLGSTAILNTLLGILNERVFSRGHTRERCPLRICVGASNALPDDPSLAAFADRFLIRVFVDRVLDPQLEELLESGDTLSRETFEHTSDLAILDALAERARVMDVAPVRRSIAHAIRELRHAGVELSDRRVVKLQRLVAAGSGWRDPACHRHGSPARGIR